MGDNLDNQEIDKTPLLKEKKTRAPPSEKQKENFKKMAEKRAENIKIRKEEKLLEAQKALLEKNGIKIEIPNSKLKEKKGSIQFEIEESESEKEEEPIPLPPIKQKKIKKEIKPIPPAKPIKKKKEPVIQESETDYSSDSSEEIIVIKRGKKKAKPQKQKQIQESDTEEEFDEQPINQPALAKINYNDFFC